jgi:hypothetical protein
MIFLICYDRAKQQLLELREFEPARLAEAIDLRFRMELDAHHRGEAREIVLLESDSIETLRITHGRYFKSFGELLQEMLPKANA